VICKINCFDYDASDKKPKTRIENIDPNEKSDLLSVILCNDLHDHSNLIEITSEF